MWHRLQETGSEEAHSSHIWQNAFAVCKAVGRKNSSSECNHCVTSPILEKRITCDYGFTVCGFAVNDVGVRTCGKLPAEHAFKSRVINEGVDARVLSNSGGAKGVSETDVINSTGYYILI